MSKIDYAQELGIDSTVATPEMEATENDTENFVQDSTTEESREEANGNTEPNISDGLNKQIEGLEKRLADKDDYINLQREQLKTKDADISIEESDTVTDFWDDPEKMIKDMQIRQDTTDRLLQERAYADTVDGYFDIVTEDKFTAALAIDKGFSDEINKSGNVYETAYKYFANKKSSDEVSKSTLRAEIKAELLKEMGIKDKPKNDNLPNMGNMGGSNGSKNDAPDDGFAAVFNK